MIRSGLSLAGGGGGARLNGGSCEASQGSLEGPAKTGSYGRIRCVGDLCKGSLRLSPRVSHRPLASWPPSRAGTRRREGRTG